MSFWFSVVRIEDEEKLPSTDMILARDEVDEATWWEAFHKWEKERAKFILYEGPLGADSTVGVFWSGIAHKIGLPLLASIYNEGLRLVSPDEIARFEKELETLQEYGDTHKLDDLYPGSGTDDQIRDHLKERLGNVREAIRIAKANGARISFS
jgi:hypothetical protein